MYTYKIMLCPNNKQATRLKQTMNKCIECQRIIFDIIDARMQKHEGLPKCTDLRREFTKLKKELDQKMLNSRINMTHQEMRDNHLDVLFSDVSNDALKQTIKDTYNSFVRFLKHLAKYPIKKEYSNKFKGFYVDPYKIRFSNTHVKLEKIATSLKENRQVLNLVKLAEKKSKTDVTKYIVYGFVISTLILTLIFIIVSIVKAPSVSVDYEKTKTDYSLQLVMTLLGIIGLLVPTFIGHKFKLDYPNFLIFLYLIFLY